MFVSRPFNPPNFFLLTYPHLLVPSTMLEGILHMKEKYIDALVLSATISTSLQPILDLIFIFSNLSSSL